MNVNRSTISVTCAALRRTYIFRSIWIDPNLARGKLEDRRKKPASVSGVDGQEERKRGVHDLHWLDATEQNIFSLTMLSLIFCDSLARSDVLHEHLHVTCVPVRLSATDCQFYTGHSLPCGEGDQVSVVRRDRGCILDQTGVECIGTLHGMVIILQNCGHLQ